MVKKMSKAQAFANKPGNESKIQVQENKAQVTAAITRFLEKDKIRRAFEAFVPQKSLMVPLMPVAVSRERIGGASVTRFEYGGRA